MIFRIEPVATTTKGDYQAFVDGIDVSSGDPFWGRVVLKDGTEHPARWRVNGDRRDAHPCFNLDVRSPEISEVLTAAKRIGARLM